MLEEEEARQKKERAAKKKPSTMKEVLALRKAQMAKGGPQNYQD